MVSKQQFFNGEAETVFRLNPLAACVKAAIAGSVLMAIASPVAAELPVPSAVWASMGGASREVIGNTMNIKQETDRVILNWAKFNVGKDNTVNFKQKASDIALNKIHDQNASQILGHVNADGHVYLVNPNGVVFGKDSRVDARAVVASTMSVSFEDSFDTETINTVINQTDGDGKHRAAFQTGSEFYEHDPETGAIKLDANGNKIALKIDPKAEIKIEQGAQLKAKEGGRILVIAPTIENSGDVEASGGQVMMAAATDKVYLQQAPTDENKADSDVRGLLVEVKTGGKVENLGNIAANRGNVTLMGFAVNQNGRVSATTSTNVNGSIRLLAREGGSGELINKEVVLRPGATTRAADKGDGLGTSAKVKLGETSKTEILPEAEYSEQEVATSNGGSVKELVEKTAIDGLKQPQSRIEMMAHKVQLKSGAEVVAPGGKVQMTATESPANPVADNRAANSSRILIDSGAKIDVSGTDTTVKTMESNVIEVELRNYELKDAPLQKDGVLKGKTIKVDIREGTPLTDIQPTVDGIKRTVAERLSQGGQIELKSEGDAIVEQGAVLDISGGQISYLDGVIDTSKLISDGRLVDISEADPLYSYDGIYGEVSQSSKKWGVTQTWAVNSPMGHGRFEKGYVEGKDAGKLLIKANQVVNDGQLLAHVVSGTRQRDVGDQASGGSLEIDNGFSFDNVQSVLIGSNPANQVDMNLDDVLPAGLGETLAIQAGMLYESGLHETVINSNGKITVADNAQVKLHDGGTLKLKGGSIEVQGDISGAGASVELETKQVTGAAGLDGDIVVADGAQINLQGQWVNDLLHPENLNGKSVAINGGKFLAKAGGGAGGNLTLKKGALIDVSGGAHMHSDGSLDNGNGGTISLIAKPSDDNIGANVKMEAEMRAYGLGQGGHFIVKANAVAIRRELGEDSGDVVQPLQITTDFFQQGGFADFDIGANMNGLTVEDGAVIRLSQQNRLLNADYMNRANDDAGIGGFSSIVSLPEHLRAPSALTLRSDHSAGSNADSKLTMAANAKIVADNGSAVTLESDSSMVVDGQIVAHGGAVAMNLVPDKSKVDPQYQARQGIWLGETAKIDVSGTAEVITDGWGHRSGKVLDGGKVSVNAQRGFLATKAGSLIDVSGGQTLLDLPVKNAGPFGVVYQPTMVGSHAGSISLTAAEGAFVDGDMLGKAGESALGGTAGGKLSLFLNTDQRQDPDSESSSFPSGARTILLSQHKAVPVQSGFTEAGDALPNALNGKGYLSVDQVEAGGFASLALATGLATTGDRGEIRFLGDIDLSLNHVIALDAARLGWQRQTAADHGTVVLTSSYASLGSDVHRTSNTAPTNGDGKLKVNADLIDLVGGTTTEGFASVDLNANQDIRLKGIRTDGAEMDFAGQFNTYSQLNLTSAQVYPTSMTAFTLGVVGDSNGKVSFNGQGSAKPVLSAMGKLTVKAPNIQQNGTIKAPLGEIVFDASKSVAFGANSVTSVSAAGQIVPLGVTQGGLEWMLPLAGTGNNLNVVDPNVKKADTEKKAIFEAPKKIISVTADRIEREEGAVVDLSGGGDMLAYEFIPGDGGSQDVLAANNLFAVIPGIGDYAPFDPQAFPDSGLGVGDSVYLSGGSGLAAGNYALLPARYALLPGAFLVTPVAGSADAVAGSKRSRVDGATIVTGYRDVAGTDIRDQGWSEFVVEGGDIAKTRSEYNISYASQFFADRAIGKELAIPRLPQDAGQLVLNAKTALQLPTVKADVATGGSGGLVDIVSEKLAIGATSALDDIELLASDIEKFKVDSLLLGAVRSYDSATGHVKLDVKAKTVTIAEDTTVKAPELLLAASDKVEMQAGARIEADGKVADQANSVLEVSGDGALLRASAGKQVAIVRTPTATSGSKGDLLVAASAAIAAGSGSVLLDSTHNTRMEGDLELDGGSLNIGAEVINLGETAGVVGGLSLDNQRLSQLKVDELVLSSRGMVNLYGQLPETDVNGKPFQFGSLVIDAKGLAGKGVAGQTTTLTAGTLTLTNSNADSGSLNGTGSSNLVVNADRLVLDKGNYRLSGFSQATFNVDQQVLGRGEGKLSSYNNLTINTPLMTAEHGAKTTLYMPGYNLKLGQGASAAGNAASQGVAAQLWLEANAIDLNTTLAYQTGIVSLYALTGDVALDSKAVIDVSGTRLQAGLSKPVALNAGNIALNAKQGNVSAATGSKLLLNARFSDADAGELSAQAAAGKVALNGDMQAHGAGQSQGGRIAVDTASLSAGEFAGLTQKIADGGFSGGIDLRTRTGDIDVAVGQALTAEAIKLTADAGKITIGGELDASGVNGGSITLASEDALTLAASAQLSANADSGSNGNGGNVLLSAFDRDGDGAGIDIKVGAKIKVEADGNGKEGEATLRADRKDTDGNGVADIDIKPIAANTITGDSDVTVEGWRSYSATSVNQSLQNTIHQHNQQYMNGIAAQGVAASRFGNGYTITPGVEVRSTGDLTVASAWDLSSWRYGAEGVPGALALRANGNLLLNQSISDGFVYREGALDTVYGLYAVSDYLQSGASWSLTLVAGADVQSVDKTAVAPVTGSSNVAANGDIKLANDVKVRTGTGDITLRAARDIIYGNANSVIYTAGRPDDSNRWGSGGDLLAAYFYAEYPLDGGDIQLQAGRNISAKPTTQLLSDAIVRTGNWSREATHTGERPTAWGVALGVSDANGYAFNPQQSVAAFGGGNVTIKAAGSVKDLSVLIPTTGKAVGQKTLPDDPASLDFASNVVEVTGGGKLQLAAGGDVAGGVFYVDGGTADLRASGSFTAGSNQSLKPILALGDSEFSIVAGKNMALEAIVDPMYSTLPASADAEGFQNRFFRYSADSVVKLTALSGNVSLENDPVRLNKFANTSLSDSSFLIYPASLQVAALNGDLTINKSFSLFPSAQGGLELFAEGNLTGNANVLLSDAEPTLLPSSSSPINGAISEVTRVQAILDPQQNTVNTHAATPLHAEDDEPVLISTGSGNIGSRTGNLGFVLSKPVEVSSGRDIIKTLFKIQHNRADDVSVLYAGRDINFPVSFNPLSGGIDNAEQGIEVAGPGQLTAIAGRHVNLGASNGIVSTGNQGNPALAEDGSDISVLAGLAQNGLDIGAFATGFLAKQDNTQVAQIYNDRLLAEMRGFSGDQNLTLADAKLAFAALTGNDKVRVGNKLLSAVQRAFLQEVNRSSTAMATATTKQDQDSSELELLATIETLFPGSTLLAGRSDYRIDPLTGGVVVDDATTASKILAAIYADQKDRPAQGNISMFLSTIQTMDGGNVNLFAPTGGIVVGLATADIGVNKDDDKMGVIVKKQGDANLLARNNIDVNVQRVVTLGGGSILGGSTEGDVDAGRSPQTALAAPPLQVSYDPSGLPLLEVSPVLAGGGIRTVGNGDITLFAPRGIIDAGEAGIAGNKITVVATAILGAKNIDFRGSGVGVPVAATGSVAAGLTGVSNLAASVTQAVEAAADIGKDTADSLAKASAALGIMTAEFLGFGD